MEESNEDKTESWDEELINYINKENLRIDKVNSMLDKIFVDLANTKSNLEAKIENFDEEKKIWSLNIDGVRKKLSLNEIKEESDDFEQLLKTLILKKYSGKSTFDEYAQMLKIIGIYIILIGVVIGIIVGREYGILVWEKVVLIWIITTPGGILLIGISKIITLLDQVNSKL